MYSEYMCLYGFNLGCIQGKQITHDCMCVCMHVCVYLSASTVLKPFNVHNHHHDPCQINRERLDGRQTAQHSTWEKVAEEEGAREQRGGKRLTLPQAAQNETSWLYLLLMWTERAGKELENTVRGRREEEVPAAAAAAACCCCCCLSGAGTAAMCRRLGPHLQRCPEHWPAGLHLSMKE